MKTEKVLKEDIVEYEIGADEIITQTHSLSSYKSSTKLKKYESPRYK